MSTKPDNKIRESVVRRNSLREISKDETLVKFKELNDNLNEEVQKLTKENNDLKYQMNFFSQIESKLKNSEDKVKKLEKEIEEYKVKKSEAEKKFEEELAKLTLKREYEEQKNKKNMDIYNQKMSVIHQIELENSIYSEEVNDLKEKNKKLKNLTKEKIESLKVENQIKFGQLKQKMLDKLIETKKNVTNLNVEYLDISSKITALQNHELLSQIEMQSQEIKSLTKENKELKKKIFDLENNIDIHEKVELSLMSKMKKEKSEVKNSNIKVKNFGKSEKNLLSSLSKNNYNLKTRNEYFSERNHNPDNNIDFSSSIIPINNNSSYGLLINSNNNNMYKTENIFKHVQSKSSISNRKKINIKDIEVASNNELSLSGCFPTMGGSTFSKTESKHKYELMLNFKNAEIEKLKNTIENLKNQLSQYFDKYKGLFNFLEECLNDFFDNNEIINSKCCDINIENIRKFNFSDFTKQEKYSLLVLLMKNLLPLITLNFNSNCNLGNNIFTTNLNLIDLKFNPTDHYLNDKLLRRAFLGKNNRIRPEFFVYRKYKNNFCNSIPVLRKNMSPIDYKIFENKYKALV